MFYATRNILFNLISNWRKHYYKIYHSYKWVMTRYHCCKWYPCMGKSNCVQLTFNIKDMEVCTPLEAATLTALHANTCPLSLFPTWYIKSDITIYVSLAGIWLDRSVAFDVTSFCPIVHCSVALGRLTVAVQVASSGFVSCILPTLPVIVGWSGFTEIIYKGCY
jgi:hypothetical protein